MPCSTPIRLLLTALALCCATTGAQAQFQWRDEAGRMVYSDLPPPPSVPPSAIVRQPRATGPTATRPASAPEPNSETTVRPTRDRATAADAAMAFRKRRMEREQAERASADTQARERRSAAACDDARSELRTMASGERIARIDERGERVILDDAGRAERMEAARRAVSEHCRPG